MSASPERGGKCRALRGDRGKSAYTGKNIKILQPLPGFFALSRTFFITILPTAFYDRSRMTGRQVTPFYIKLFPFLLTLAPFVNLSVDTFPDKRGRLSFSILSFMHSFISYYFLKIRILFPQLFAAPIPTTCVSCFFLNFQTKLFKVPCFDFDRFSVVTVYKISFISVYYNKNGLFSVSFPFSKVLIEISSQNHFYVL